MNLDSKKAVQGSFFDLLVAMNPTVGDIVEIGMGLCWTALMQLHHGDTVASAASMREALDQVLAQLPKVQTPLGVVHGGKLDS